MEIGYFRRISNGERGDNTVFEDSLRIKYNIFCTDQVFVCNSRRKQSDFVMWS